MFALADRATPRSLQALPFSEGESARQAAGWFNAETAVKGSFYVVEVNQHIFFLNPHLLRDFPCRQAFCTQKCDDLVAQGVRPVGGDVRLLWSAFHIDLLCTMNCRCQIELERQNEVLHQAKNEFEEAREGFVEL